MKILMIGGTGTISLPITQALAKNKNVECYVLNRGNKNRLLPDSCHFLTGDFNNKDEMTSLIKDLTFDVVCNFITFTPEQAKTNIDLFTGKTKQFIFISTAATYNHDLTCCLDENSVLGNRYSQYGLNKAACEEIFLKAYKEHQFPITIVRPTQTYSNDRIPLSVKGKTCWSVIDRMIKGKEVIIHGDGQSVWSSTHAEDFAKGFLGLIGLQNAIGETYQIMNDETHTWDEVYQELARLLQVEYKPVYIPSHLLAKSKTYDLLTSIQGDKHFSVIFDTTKIKQAVPSFECTIKIKDGLKRYLEYMDAHPELKKEDKDFDIWCNRVIDAYKKAVQSVEKIL